MDKLPLLVSLITEENDSEFEQAAPAQTAAMKVGASVEILCANNHAVLQTRQILELIPGTIQTSRRNPGRTGGNGNAACMFSVLSDHEQIGKI